jgi:D-alanine-D-alanine ligase-like ATP-grasp enzyme
MWLEAARNIGAELRELSPWSVEISRGAARTRVMGQTVTLNDCVSIELAEDNVLTYELLVAEGLPVPEYLVFDGADGAAATAFLEAGPVPCVVKPTRGSGGEGVTGEVRRKRDVRRAVLVASRFDKRCLIERQITGDLFRFLLLDGEVLDTLRRRAPHVAGDGRSTIGELVHAEYDRRIAADGVTGLKPFVVDLDCLLTLRQASLSIDSVLERGRVVRVKTVSNYNSPSENETVRDPVAPSLREELAHCAAELGLRLAGIDVITDDLSKGLAESGGVLLDVNGSPGLHHHYLVADPPAATRVAVLVLQAVLQGANRRWA